MQYSILFYESPADLAARSDPAKREAFWGSFLPYLQAIKDAGIFVGGTGLELPDTAATISFEQGRHVVHDGPYAETKEQLGGFVIVDVPDRDSALAWARRCPPGEGRKVEVRPNLRPMG